jgi:hypothetical protein
VLTTPGGSSFALFSGCFSSFSLIVQHRDDPFYHGALLGRD